MLGLIRLTAELATHPHHALAALLMAGVMSAYGWLLMRLPPPARPPGKGRGRDCRFTDG